MASVLLGRLRRAASVVVATGLLTGGLALLAAPQAAASTSTVSPLSVAYIDSVAPHTSLTPVSAGDVPVGTFLGPSGGGAPLVHTSKSYFTFDVSAFKGATLSSAMMIAEQTGATDCTTTPDIQAWLTNTARKPTWDNQPTEQTRLPDLGGGFGCPQRPVVWDALTTIQGALAAGRTTVTIVLRLPDSEQSDPAFGVRFNPDIDITFQYNRLPNKPETMTVNGSACTSAPLGESAGTFVLGAIVTDPDNDNITAQFVYWPVKNPDQRTEIDEPSFPNPEPFPTRAFFSSDKLNDATTYAWQVRGVDAQGPGPWSAVCKFSTDFTAPSVAPSVTSAQYPAGQSSGGGGVPGTFTFGARGVKDVVGYLYGTGFSSEPTTFVAATTKGGPATVQITPTDVGPFTVTVVSVDAVGNRSPQASYSFFVADNRPSVSCTPQSALIGTARQCVFGPGVNTGTVSYTYHVDNGPATTVPAGPDGTATVTVTPTTTNGSATVVAAANLSNGVTTAAGSDFLGVDPADPLITQTPDQPIVGVPETFTFQPVQPNVVSYTYQVNQGTPTTIPAGPDGTATITYTPTTSTGGLDLQVFSTDVNGVNSGTAEQFVGVESNGPNVSSADYPPFTFAGVVGQPGTFTLSSPLPNVVAYTATLNSDTPVTQQAAADGTLALVLTPTTSGEQFLSVTSTFADGTVSEPTTYIFFVNATAQQASKRAS